MLLAVFNFGGFDQNVLNLWFKYFCTLGTHLEDYVSCLIAVLCIEKNCL